ncbi:type I restriction endonuclease subunit M [Brevundimonas intermedia]|uniref:site-specific DNA-methyltransferase (adenine-specific) n=1 Tax=Brevundimonas intermedia TaxID=74315 RepID=A0A4Y9RTD8_9CAUL|nr:DNA methyltransferase [Brevundimonas intermedia]TFW12163.1 type I restriction endonuclease subunit M [Brevundimonas intermedia]
MNLFNRKTLKRVIKPAPIPASHLSVLEGWAELIRTGRVYTHKETALREDFTSEIVKGVLGYKGPASGAAYTLAAEQSILRGSVDLALGHFGEKIPEILAPFELKGADTRDLDAIMPGRNKTPVQQAWEYAMNARGVKWVIVSNMVELRLYGFGEGTIAYEVFHLDRLTEPEEYARLMLLLSAGRLLSGGTLDLLKQSREEDRDITDSLYRDYKSLRLKLIGAVQAADPAIAALDSIAVAQKILDRVLFIAFAEDTGLLPYNTLSQAFVDRDPYNPRPVWDNFRGLFNAIDKGSDALKIPRYNGGLFRQDDTIDALALPDEVCEGFKALGEYDFASEVSVTVLGHIFEQSIADVERLQAQARGEEAEEVRATGTTGRRKRDGVVYTPDYIARFIVAETLGRHLEEAFATIVRAYAKAGADLSDYATIPWRRKSAELEAWQAYRERLKSLRIVDPACGSGVFLIMAFDFLKAELTRVNDKIKDLLPKAEHYGDLLEYVPDSDILTNNLFGVDVNVESVEIAKLSLWIKTARRGKVLDSLDASLRVGDSLIEDSNFAYLDHAFRWETAFPSVFAEGGFDVVLGNPPYVRMELLKTLKPYLEKRYEVVSDRADLYCYFYERGLRLLKPGGRLGYISSSTFLRNGSGRPLRDYLSKKSTIESIVDFGDLQIFDGVATLPIILTARRGAAPSGHELKFWQLEAVPETNFQAAWEKAAGAYPQAALSSGPWELENTTLRSLRDKIRGGRKTLKEVYGAPLYGIKTGLNRAFVIPNEIKERLCAKDPNSADLLKPFLEGKDLKRWRAEPRGLWLIYIPKGRIDINDYPAIREWLWPFKEELEKRATKQAWFELQQAQDAYVSNFESRKIIYAEFNRRYFSFASSDTYFNNKIFMSASGDASLLSLLQSSVYWFLLISMAPQVIGGSRELRSQYVETMPIPMWTTTSQSELARLGEKATATADARLSLQIALTRRISDLCPAGRDAKLTSRLQEWWTLPDFSAFRAEVKKAFKADIPLADRSAWEDWINRDRGEIARLSAEITQAEAQIDNIVYGLFNLTSDEIALLESVVSR